MRLVYVVFILLLALMTSAQCQMTAEDQYNKGLALYNQSKYDDAIQAYDEAIRLDPNDTRARAYKADSLENQGKSVEATVVNDEAIELRHDQAMDWYNKGVALDDQGNHYAAFGAYKEATRIDPNLAEAWYKQGIYLYNVSDKLDTYDQAIVNPCDILLTITY